MQPYQPQRYHTNKDATPPPVTNPANNNTTPTTTVQHHQQRHSYPTDAIATESLFFVKKRSRTHDRMTTAISIVTPAIIPGSKSTSIHTSTLRYPNDGNPIPPTTMPQRLTHPIPTTRSHPISPFSPPQRTDPTLVQSQFYSRRRPPFPQLLPVDMA